MADNVLHGALALVKKNGTVVGKMRNVSWSETTRRAEVQGLGTLLLQELPAVQHGGTLRASFYEVSFQETGIPGAIRRDVQTDAQFEDNVLLDEGFQLDIFKKISDVVDSSGRKRSKLTPYAIIRGLFIEGDGIDITEGSVSGRNQDFRFTKPVIFPE
jgi:hypothetical protein